MGHMRIYRNSVWTYYSVTLDGHWWGEMRVCCALTEWNKGGNAGFHDKKPKGEIGTRKIPGQTVGSIEFGKEKKR